MAAGCADRKSLVYRIQEAGQPQKTASTSTVRTNSNRSRKTQPSEQTAAAPVSEGPMVLAMPLAPPATDDTPRQPTATPAEPENRFAFLDWFGAAAETAKVASPVQELRKSRAVTASLQASTPNAAPAAPKQPVVVGEDSRLMLTFDSSLQNPNGTEAPLRGADITGSIHKASPRKDPPKPAPIVISRKAEQPKSVSTTTPKNEPRRDALPGIDNPVRIQLASDAATFNAADIAVLQRMASLQKSSGRTLHIRAVSRGRAGGTSASLIRARRMHRYTSQAIAELSRLGVSPNRISTSIDEQLTTGDSDETALKRDRDRLELSLN